MTSRMIREPQFVQLSPVRVPPTNAEISHRPALVEVPDRRREVLLWHWGRTGAGSFTYELARELWNVPGLQLTVSAAEGSQLAMLAGADKNIALRTVRTFHGDKTSWAGKLNAALALFSLWQLARDFRGILSERQTDVAICTFQSIWDLPAIPVLRRHANRFILILHDAKMHPGDNYPFRESVLRWRSRPLTLSSCFPTMSVVPHRSSILSQRTASGLCPMAHYLSDQALLRRASFRVFVRCGFCFLDGSSNTRGLATCSTHIVYCANVGWRLNSILSDTAILLPDKPQLAGLPDVSIANIWVDDEQIAQALARADVVILPYIEASQSGVAAAALTAALPVVATPVGGLVEQVRCGQTGIIAKGMDTEDLAAGIQSLTGDPPLYETCSAGALRHARDELGWTRIATRIRRYREGSRLSAEPARPPST